jgi:phage-related protein
VNLLDLFIKVGIDDQATNGISGIADKAKNVAGAVGDGLAAAAKVGMAAVGTVSAGVAALTGKALSAAGELEQNMGGSEAVFKEYAEGMQKTAETAYENMGLSASGFLATANKMGALFQGAGFDIGDSASLAADAMQRAADVASIMGLDVSAAMESVAGAAKGNFTMMDNLGVAINDTTLQQYALEKGIEKTTQQMTTQEKVGLAMELFMERTAYAAGNYSKENATLAGSLGTAKAALDDFLSGAGSVDALVSSFSNAAKVIQNNVIEILPRLVESGAAAVEALAPEIPVMFDQILPVAVDAIASIMGSLGGVILENVDYSIQSVFDAGLMIADKLIEGIGGFSEGFGVLLESLVMWVEEYNNVLVEKAVLLVTAFVQAFMEGSSAFSSAAISIIMSLANGIVNNLPLILDCAQTLLGGLINGIATKVEMFAGIASSIVSALAGYLSEKLPELASAALAIVSSIAGYIVEKLPELATSAVSIIRSIVGFLMEKLPDLAKAGVDLIKSLMDRLPEAISFICALLPDIIISIADTLLDFVVVLAKAGVQLFVALVDYLPQIIEGIVAVLPDIIGAIIDTIVGLLPVIAEAGIELFCAITRELPAALVRILAVIPKITSGIRDALLSKTSDIIDAGKQLLAGLAQGIVDGWNAVKDSIANTFSAVTDFVKGIFDVHSPSRVFAGIGENLMEGLWMGVDRTADSVMSRIGDAIQIPKATVDFSASALGRSSAATINSMLAVSGNGGMPAKIEVPVYLNGRKIAQATYDDLEQIRKQKG